MTRIAAVSILLSLLLDSTPAAAQAWSALAEVEADAPSDEPAESARRTRREAPRALRLSAHLGYAMGGKIDVEDASATLQGGALVGATLGYAVRPGAVALISFSHQANEVLIRDDIAGESLRRDMDINRFQIGGELSRPLARGLLWPAFAATIGATEFHPDAPELGSHWAFSWLAEGSLTLWPLRMFGLGAFVRWHGVVVNADTAAFCVTDQQCTVLRSTELLFQGEVGATLTLAL